MKKFYELEVFFTWWFRISLIFVTSILKIAKKNTFKNKSLLILPARKTSQDIFKSRCVHWFVFHSLSQEAHGKLEVNDKTK